jgi:lysylphosphatidylglycerol synthetase-like protein (DUF2156 family)
MGANPTQAQAVVLFFVAFTLIAAGLASNMSMIWLLAGIVALAVSIVLFRKCKPWEQKEE